MLVLFVKLHWLMKKSLFQIQLHQQLNQVHFLLEIFFSSNVALLDLPSSATETISFSSNLSVIFKPSDLENIASEKNDESSTDFSKILDCKKDVTTLTNLKNLRNAKKIKLMRSVFAPSKSYVFPVTVRHFKYDWLEQYSWLCYSPIEDGGYCLYCVVFS